MDEPGAAFLTEAGCLGWGLWPSGWCRRDVPRSSPDCSGRLASWGGRVWVSETEARGSGCADSGEACSALSLWRGGRSPFRAGCGSGRKITPYGRCVASDAAPMPCRERLWSRRFVLPSSAWPEWQRRCPAGPKTNPQPLRWPGAGGACRCDGAGRRLACAGGSSRSCLRRCKTSPGGKSRAARRCSRYCCATQKAGCRRGASGRPRGCGFGRPDAGRKGPTWHVACLPCRTAGGGA